LVNQDLASLILDDPVFSSHDWQVDQGGPNTTQRVVEDDLLGGAVNILGDFTLADVQHGAEGHAGSLGQEFYGHVKPQVVVVGHVLLLSASDGVVVLGYGYGSV
jgi:hypothetical protein